MVRRQTVAMPNQLSHQVILHRLTAPIAERLEMRKVCGPYTMTRTTPTDNAFFYCDSNRLAVNDGPVNLRLEWCDEIDEFNGGFHYRSIKHTGWYTNYHQDEKIRGVIARLPSGRGFLAGWSYGEGMSGALERDVHDCIVDAARAADDIAERLAESEREYHAACEAHQDAADTVELITSDVNDIRHEHSETVNTLQAICDGPHADRARDTLRKKLQCLRGRQSGTIERLREARDTLEGMPCPE